MGLSTRQVNYRCLPHMNGTKHLIVYEVCSIFFNLQKAFDSVPHHSLIAKLSQLNISDFLLKWITDYLTDRSQCVGVEGTTSPTLPVLSGVLQGSLHGPLLCIIYIDGLTMSCPTAACICMQTIFSCIGLYILILTIKPCRLTLMHYLTGFQPTSYSLTVISASVCLCLKRGISPCQLHY